MPIIKFPGSCFFNADFEPVIDGEVTMPAKPVETVDCYRFKLAMEVGVPKENVLFLVADRINDPRGSSNNPGPCLSN